MTGSGQLAGASESAPVDLDCRYGSPICPEVVIDGDPWPAIPGHGPSPFRGYADPSIRKDPDGDRLWMTYSFLDLHRGANPEPGVSIHLASSDDGGATWRFRRVLERSRGGIDPSRPGDAGVSVYEVSTLAPLEIGSRTRWFGTHMRYFQPFGPEPRRPGSFHLPLARANRPTDLGRRHKSRLAGTLIEPAWKPTLELSSLAPELEECSAWTEPSLFGVDGTLYLVAQCVIVRPLTGKRRPAREFIGVFASNGLGAVRDLDWSWRGKLTKRSDATALGGQVLTQPDLAWSRDGSLLLLVTPKRLSPSEKHLGCRVLEVDSLDSPKLRRTAGKPVVRARIESSDSTGLGPGLCAYDAASSTGVLFVRTEIDLRAPDVVFRLHATGIHP